MLLLRRTLDSGKPFLVAGALVHLCMLLSLQWGFLNPLFDDAVHRSGQGVDFYSVVQAGRNLADGVSIYSTKPVEQIVPYYNPYRYHPFVAYTIGVLSAALRPDVAYVLWIVILEGLLLLNILLTRSLFPDSRAAAAATGLWLLFSPYYLELYMGQFSFLMASLLFWSLLAWMKGNDRSGDFLWMLSLVVKSNSAVFAPVLLKLRRWKLVVVAAVVSVGLALPYFILQPGSAADFSLNFTQSAKAQTLFGNQGFAALIGTSVLRFSGLWSDFAQEFALRIDRMNDLLVLPLALWTAVVVGSSLIVTIRTSRDSGIMLILLWILAYFLFYKHVWEHQYVMMIPVFVLLYHQSKLGMIALPPLFFWTVFGVVAMPTAFVFIDRSPVLFDPEIPWRTWESLLFHAPKPLAVLTLFGFLCIRLCSSKGKQGALL
jgi:hypothetical protein